MSPASLLGLAVGDRRQCGLVCVDARGAWPGQLGGGDPPAEPCSMPVVGRNHGRHGTPGVWFCLAILVLLVAGDRGHSVAQPSVQTVQGEVSEQRVTLAVTLPDGREALLPVVGGANVAEEADKFCRGLYEDRSNASAAVFVSECLHRIQQAAEGNQKSTGAPAAASSSGPVVLRMPVEITGRTLALELRRFETRAEAAARFLHRFSVPFVSDVGKDMVALLASELDRRCRSSGILELHIAVNEHRSAVLRAAETESATDLARQFCEQPRFGLQGEDFSECIDQAQGILEQQRGQDPTTPPKKTPLFSLPAMLGSTSTEIPFYEGDSPLGTADKYCTQHWGAIHQGTSGVDMNDCVSMLNQTLTDILTRLQQSTDKRVLPVSEASSSSAPLPPS